MFCLFLYLSGRVDDFLERPSSKFDKADGGSSILRPHVAWSEVMRVFSVRYVRP